MTTNVGLLVAAIIIAFGIALAAVIARTSRSIKRTELGRTTAEFRSVELELRHRELWERAPVGLFRTTPDSVLVDANPALVELSGYPSREAIVGTNTLEHYVEPEDRVRFRALIEKEGIVRNFPLRFRRYDGTEIWVVASAHMVRDSVGNVRFMEGALIDVTEQKRAEERLTESERRFRQMAEHIKEAFFVVDLATGAPLYVSPTWADIWGRTQEERLDGAVWFNAVHPDDRNSMKESQEAVRRGEQSDITFRVVRPDGSTRWVRGRAFPVRDTAGNVYRMAGVSEDVTELRQAEQRLTQAQKMEAVGRLAGGVAHDFNNLLTVISSYAGFVAEALPEGDPRRDDVAQITIAAARSAELTKQLLAFSRQQLLQPRVLDLNKTLAGVDAMLRRVIGEDVTLTAVAAPNLGCVRADPGQIEQIVVNLAVNARDAMPTGGCITLETANVEVDETFARTHAPQLPGSYVMLAVSDTGVGMDAETLKHAFEPFFTTKERGHGTGLGLSTVYGIVKQSGGYVWVDSEPGRGATFRVYLPRVRDPAETVATHKRPLTPSRGTETVLLVEDNDPVLRIAQRTLVALGYRVIAAASADEAERCAREDGGRIDLVFTDVVMPGASGRELVDRLHAVRSDFRVLYASGYTNDAVVRHGVSHEHTAFLQKPYTPERLAQSVRETLDG